MSELKKANDILRDAVDEAIKCGRAYNYLEVMLALGGDKTKHYTMELARSDVMQYPSMAIKNVAELIADPNAVLDALLAIATKEVKKKDVRKEERDRETAYICH